MALVFVYGSLMRGRSNHRVLERLDARFVAAAKTREPRCLVDLGPYPALLHDGFGAAHGPVSGELWELDDAGLVALDAFEGCPHLYRREPIALVVEAPSGGEAQASVYVLAGRPPPHARPITSGRWELNGSPEE